MDIISGDVKRGDRNRLDRCRFCSSAEDCIHPKDVISTCKKFTKIAYIILDRADLKIVPRQHIFGIDTTDCNHHGQFTHVHASEAFSCFESLTKD